MRKTLGSLVLLLILCSYAFAATLATDDFNRSDNADLGASWTEHLGFDPCELASNAVRAPAPPATCAEAFTTLLPEDQWVSILIATLSGSGTPGVQVRGTEGGLDFYGCFVNTDLTTLFKFVGGSYFEIGNTAVTTWEAGDRITLDVVGDNLDCKKNEVSALTGVGAGDVAGSGYAGINVDETTTVDDFRAGDFTRRTVRRVIVID